MKACLLDTDILSLLFRNHIQVVEHCQEYLRQYPYLTFSQISHYEILSGLRHRDANKQLESFLSFAEQNEILALTKSSITESAKLYASLRKKGIPVDDMDLLIAGVAITHDLVLVTHNQKHFRKIDILELQDWTI